MILPNEDHIFIACNCRNEILRVAYEQYENDPAEFNLCIYTMGTDQTKPSMRYKLRHIWKILRDGTPYEDMMILNKTEMERLCKFVAKKMESE